MTDIAMIEALARADGISYGVYVSIHDPAVNKKNMPYLWEKRTEKSS